MGKKQFLKRSILAMALGSTVFSLRAQTVDFDVKYPRMNEGQMFTIKLVPSAKTTRIYVIGKQAAKIKMTDVGLKISLVQDDKSTPIETSVDGDHFVLTLPTDQMASKTHLKLNVKYKDKNEEIEVPVELRRH